MPRKLTKEEFVTRARHVHGNLYDYSHVEYRNNATPVVIECSEHGLFSQKPNCHVDMRQGCPKCGRAKCDNNRRLTQAEFIERAKILHGTRYDYSKTKYEHNSKPVTIVCLLHGEFQQIAYNHIKQTGYGCPRCGHLGVSKVALRWLERTASTENIFIQHAGNTGEYKVPGTRYRVDGYCSKTNTLYEFYGDRWHGNPKLFKPNEYCHPFKRVKAKRLLEHTLKREKHLKDLGYNVVAVWEADYLRSINT